VQITIVHGAQTGVDLAAHDAAVHAGIQIAGFVPADGSNEHGPIDPRVLAHLKPLREGGLLQRTIANVTTADAVLAIVEDRHTPYATGGTALSLQAAQSMHKPRRAVDASWPLDRLVTWVREAAAGRECFRLMVCGPRYSRWPGGFMVAYTLVHALCMKLSAPKVSPWRS
jgi:hypothetical protein